MTVKLVSTYQQGGGVYVPPYVTYQPLPTASEAVSSSGSSSDEEKGLTEKDLAQLMKDYEGLPSDMAVIQERLISFFQSQSLRSGVNAGTANLASTYTKILGLIKQANYNKDEYDNAYQQVSKNGGINEVAINDRGQFVCSNSEGDFKFMTAEELKKSVENEEGYFPLTNSELLYYRAQDVSLANNNRLLSVVQNGIGMEVVTEMIQKAMSALASSETSQEGYVSTQAGKLLQGLEDFEKAVSDASGSTYDGTVDDLYKYKFLTKDQAKQAEAAFAYIYSTLPANAKALLKAKSDLTEEGAQKLVQTLVASRMDTKQNFELDLEGGVSNRTAKNASASGDQNLKESQIVEMLRGQGGDWNTMMIDRSDGIEMTVDGQTYHNLRDSMDNKPIGNTTMLDMLQKSGILDNAKKSLISFGDQVLKPEALANIAYTGTGVMRVELPINPDGTVNLSLLESYENAEKQIKSLGPNPDPEKVKEIWKESGLTTLFHADGTRDNSKFGLFFLVNGLTTDRLSGVSQSKFIRELSRTEARTMVPLLETCLSEGNGKGNVPKIDRKNALSPGDAFHSWYDHLYKGVVFIPVNGSMTDAAIAGNQRLSVYTEANALEKLYQDAPQKRSLGTTSADVLGID